jgi:hypothetical protein
MSFINNDISVVRVTAITSCWNVFKQTCRYVVRRITTNRGTCQLLLFSPIKFKAVLFQVSFPASQLRRYRHVETVFSRDLCTLYSTYPSSVLPIQYYHTTNFYKPILHPWRQDRLALTSEPIQEQTTNCAWHVEQEGQTVFLSCLLVCTSHSFPGSPKRRKFVNAELPEGLTSLHRYQGYVSV